MEYPLTEEEEKRIQPLVTKYTAIGAAAAEAWVEHREINSKIKKSKKEGQQLFFAALASYAIGWLFDSDGFKYFAWLCFAAAIAYPYFQCKELERKLERINDKIDRFAFDWALQFGGDKAIRSDLPFYVIRGNEQSGYFFDRDSPEFNRWLINHKLHLYWAELGHLKGAALNRWEEKWYESKYGEPCHQYY